jgi:hypothetical protein
MSDLHVPCWWQFSEERLLELLHRVEAGETADEVYMSEYANADITHVSGSDDDG